MIKKIIECVLYCWAGILAVVLGVGGLILVGKPMVTEEFILSDLLYGFLCWTVLAIGCGIIDYIESKKIKPKKYYCDRCNASFTSNDDSQHLMRNDGSMLDLCIDCKDKVKKI